MYAHIHTCAAPFSAILETEDMNGVPNERSKRRTKACEPVLP
jgi:hypothetical protein